MPLPLSKPFLIAELILLMFGVPLLIWLYLPPSAIPAVVLSMALLCYLIARGVDNLYAKTRHDRPGHKRRSWNWHMVNKKNLVPMFIRFGFFLVVMLVFTYLLHRELMFSFVLNRPWVWAAVMLIYPVLSVVPQEIIFRRYLFTRFSTIFRPPVVMILVSGLGFGFAHVIFDNWVAPLFCAIGGLLFAHTYQKTRSLALVCVEHALYGNAVFTIGLGRFFYHGAIGMTHKINDFAALQHGMLGNS